MIYIYIYKLVTYDITDMTYDINWLTNKIVNSSLFSGIQEGVSVQRSCWNGRSGETGHVCELLRRHNLWNATYQVTQSRASRRKFANVSSVPPPRVRPSISFLLTNLILDSFLGKSHFCPKFAAGSRCYLGSCFLLEVSWCFSYNSSFSSLSNCRFCSLSNCRTG